MLASPAIPLAGVVAPLAFGDILRFATLQFHPSDGGISEILGGRVRGATFLKVWTVLIRWTDFAHLVEIGFTDLPKSGPPGFAIPATIPPAKSF